MSLELNVSILSIIVSVLGTIAIIITTIITSRRSSNDIIRILDENRKERVKFETETRKTLKNHTEDMSELKADMKSLRKDLSELSGKFDAFFNR